MCESLKNIDRLLPDLVVYNVYQYVKPEVDTVKAFSDTNDTLCITKLMEDIYNLSNDLYHKTKSQHTSGFMFRSIVQVYDLLFPEDKLFEVFACDDSQLEYLLTQDLNKDEYNKWLDITTNRFSCFKGMPPQLFQIVVSYNTTITNTQDEIVPGIGYIWQWPFNEKDTFEIESSHPLCSNCNRKGMAGVFVNSMEKILIEKFSKYEETNIIERLYKLLNKIGNIYYNYFQE